VDGVEHVRLKHDSIIKRNDNGDRRQVESSCNGPIRVVNLILGLKVEEGHMDKSLRQILE